MQYGFFDDNLKEYVITNPATPKSWSNYLGSTEYGAIITNNAGGYSFYKSGGMGRYMRLRFNSIPMDQPGRYIYLRDENDGDFWSSSWQPVGKSLEEYKSICRHGTAYTIIESEYKQIKTESTYFVPLNQNYEIWKIKIKNNDSVKRKLNAFTYVEYGGNWNAIDDLLNLQYVQYIADMKVVDGIVDHGTNVNMPEMPENFKEKDQGRHTFQAVVGTKVTGFDTDREKFIGNYRTYANPIVVETGKSNNNQGYADNACGSIQTKLELEPGQEIEFAVILGIGKAEVEGKSVKDKYSDLLIIDKELNNVKEYWHSKISGLTAETPDEELNSTINTWGIYNSLITFAWSRAASLIYSGIDRDGFGYRDTVQDFLGVLHAIPEEVKERLELMITGQVSTGGALPCVYPISHNPGSEKLPEESEYRSDDALWLFNAVPAYIKETGDVEFYKKVLPYADTGSDTVYKHLKRAIQFSLDRSGKNGFPCGLSADWNDCLKFGEEGESVFVAFQLRYGLTEYINISELLNKHEEKKWAEEILETLDDNIHSNAWDGDWFRRGFGVDGTKFGSVQEKEGQIYLNSQSWAVLSGTASNLEAEKSMDNVNKLLATEFGIKLCYPPYTNSDFNIVRAQLFNPGLKENGGIFVHTQGWAVMAEAKLGNGNRAYEYLRSYLPAAYNKKAEVREIEPYVLCQSTYTELSPRPGASRLPWLSGSATWTYYAITQYILGIKPEYYGLTIDPCIPSDWKKFKVERNFRNKKISIEVLNENNNQKGVKTLKLNGKVLENNFIAFDDLKDENLVSVIM